MGIASVGGVLLMSSWKTQNHGGLRSIALIEWASPDRCGIPRGSPLRNWLGGARVHNPELFFQHSGDLVLPVELLPLFLDCVPPQVRGRDQMFSRQCDSSPGSRQRAQPALSQGGFWAGLVVDAALVKIRDGSGCQVELKTPFPSRIKFDLSSAGYRGAANNRPGFHIQKILLAIRFDPVDTRVHLLLYVLNQAERLDETIAQPDVHDPRLST